MVREHSLCKSDFDTLLWKEHSVTVHLVLLHVQGGKGKVEYQQINFFFLSNITLSQSLYLQSSVVDSVDNLYFDLRSETASS